MRNFFDDNVFLGGDTAARLYKEVKDLPVFDYHCHLSPYEIYVDRRFEDIGQLWLEADHYKWRLMRSAGVDEKYITSKETTFRQKFEQFVRILPDFAGNPVYHWAHLELKKYFGLTLPICAENADKIWESTKSVISGGFSARQLIVCSNVDTVITTDDPISDLSYHKLLKNEESRFRVLPCFRCDNSVNIENSGGAEYVKELSECVGDKIECFEALKRALEERLDYFVENGCTAADVSFENFPSGCFDESAADRCLKAVLDGNVPNERDLSNYKQCLLYALAGMFKERDIVMQIHVGVMRNVNTGRYLAVGSDCGGDSIANATDVRAAAELLDGVERRSGLPRMIVYTLNPNSYYPLSTLLGDFWDKERGRLQLGAAWWFMDSRDGISEQLKVFAGTNGLGLFNGMLTDSRSFVSYARHDYFRRILCTTVGEWIDRGEYPGGKDTVNMLKNICYYNAKNFFGGVR